MQLATPSIDHFAEIHPQPLLRLQARLRVHQERAGISAGKQLFNQRQGVLLEHCLMHVSSF